jgi:hypothetical protein
VEIRNARWLLWFAAIAALGLAHGSSGPATAPHAPTVTGPASDPIREAAAAKASAGRFLDLYASAADGHLSAAERNAIAATSASQVSELLVDQPPDKLRTGGRLVGLSLEPAAGGTFAGVGKLRFRGLSEVTRLTLDRYPDGSWRVTTFNPAVAAPKLGERH